MHFGLDVRATTDPLGFEYGPGVDGPVPELRSLDSIRKSLRNPNCSGPDPVYAISMDVSRREDRDELLTRMLLIGLVTYAAGRLGEEPVRSQGHVHAISKHSGWSPPELYEIWSGEAIIYMQEHAGHDPGRCFAVHAKPGERVLVPPGWAHATISANSSEPLTFAALCDREYGFLYEEVRRRQGLAWYPLLAPDGALTWGQNEHYKERQLEFRQPRTYEEFGVQPGIPLYSQLRSDFARYQWISKPEQAQNLWHNFVP